MNIHRYYEILEVDPETPPVQLRQAYEDLLQAWDPEAFSGNPDLKKKAERKINEIQEAYRKIILFSASSGRVDLNGQKPSREGHAAFVAGHQTTTKTAAQGNRSNYLRIHPWYRFSGRMIDYLLFVLVLQTLGFFEIPIFRHIPSFFFPVIASFCWTFVEALLLGSFGTTVGKWVFNIEMIDRFLKRPGYRSAWLRSLSVWCNGMGTGFFLITPATLLVSYFRLRRERMAPWDRTGRFHMVHHKMEIRRLISASLLFVAVLFSGSLFEKNKDAIREAAIERETADEGATFSSPQKTSMVSDIKKTNGNSVRPKRDEVQLSEANGYLARGRYDEAARVYRSMIATDPTMAEARYGLGVCYAKMHRYAAAEEELKEAVRLAPEYAEAHHILGLQYINSGNREGALAQYRTLSDLDEKLAEELNGFIRNMDNFVENGRGPAR